LGRGANRGLGASWLLRHRRRVCLQQGATSKGMLVLVGVRLNGLHHGVSRWWALGTAEHLHTAVTVHQWHAAQALPLTLLLCGLLQGHECQPGPGVPGGGEALLWAWAGGVGTRQGTPKKQEASSIHNSWGMQADLKHELVTVCMFVAAQPAIHECCCASTLRRHMLLLSCSMCAMRSCDERLQPGGKQHQQVCAPVQQQADLVCVPPTCRPSCCWQTLAACSA
jgi:hypothetical protein